MLVYSAGEQLFVTFCNYKIYNPRENFQRYWFLVSKKDLKPYIRQYKCYHILSVAQQFYRYRR